MDDSTSPWYLTLPAPCSANVAMRSDYDGF